jgi:hypothetical protein
MSAARKVASKKKPDAANGRDPIWLHEHGKHSHDEQWVVLIYMAATSMRLRKIMEQDLADMRSRLRLLNPDSIRVWAQLDTTDGSYVIRQALHQRFNPKVDRTHAAPATDEAKDVGAKAFFLRDFIKWRFAEPDLKAFPKTLLILWGHSQGVAAALSQPGSPAYAMVGNGGFGFDDLSGDSLSLPQIRQSIAKGAGQKTIDIVSFDSCFMSAAEVTAEFQRTPPPPPAGTPRVVRDEEPAYVDYVVASQSAVLLDGLDYGRIADAFVAEEGVGRISPEDLGKKLLAQACSGNRTPASLSLLRIGGDPKPYNLFQSRLKELVDQLGRVLDTGLEEPTFSSPPQRLPYKKPEAAKQMTSRALIRIQGPNRSEWLRIRDAFEGATWHRVRQFVDVGDLCRRLANNSRDEVLRDKAQNLLDSLRPNSKDSLVADVRSTHPLILSGFSIYCPWLFPTPQEAREGAWNAVVDLFEYATELWFNRGSGTWGAFLFHAKHLLEESRQRAINAEVADIRNALGATPGAPPYLRMDDRAAFRFSKPPDDLFHSAEPVAEPPRGLDPEPKANLQSFPHNIGDRDADRAAAHDPRISVSLLLPEPGE